MSKVNLALIALLGCAALTGSLYSQPPREAKRDERPGKVAADTEESKTLEAGLKIIETQRTTNIESAKEELREFAARPHVLREIVPLALATTDGSGSVDCGSDWISITKPMYGTYLTTPTLADHKRILVVRIRDANDAVRPQGDEVKYRLWFPWVSETGAELYDGNRYWGSLNEGGVTTFVLIPRESAGGNVLNPTARGRHGENYFQFQCRTRGCTNRVYSASLLVYDVK